MPEAMSIEVVRSAEGDYLIRLEEVRRRTALCTSAIYQAMKEDTFPRSLEIGTRARAWSAREVDAWVAARVRTALRKA